MNKYKGKYRIESNRLKRWDYSSDAMYFITLVTQGRECNLGEIVKSDGRPIEMILSDFGKIIETEWLKSFEIRNELYLDEYIIMPNHLHAIVEIYNENRDDKIDGNMMGDDIGGNDMIVEPHGRVSLQSYPSSYSQPSPVEPPILPEFSPLPFSSPVDKALGWLES